MAFSYLLFWPGYNIEPDVDLGLFIHIFVYKLKIQLNNNTICIKQ